MCAIGGLYLKPGKKIDMRSHLEVMVQIQHHRGPDASGVWLSNDQSLGLSHNRLSILDLSLAGNQPMHSIDGRYTIVFNDGSTALLSCAHCSSHFQIVD